MKNRKKKIGRPPIPLSERKEVVAIRVKRRLKIKFVALAKKLNKELESMDE